MKTVEIVDYYGKTHCVQVEDGVYEEIENLKVAERKHNRREKRHRVDEINGKHNDPNDYTMTGDLYSLADVVIEREEREALYAAIEKLSPIQRRRVYMYMRNMSYAQIAREEGCTHVAAQCSLHNAFEKLRLMLSDWY